MSTFFLTNNDLRNQVLADSDGNNGEYTNISQNSNGLIYDRPTLQAQLDAGYSDTDTKINYYLHASGLWGRGNSKSVFSCEGLTLNDLRSINLLGSITNYNVWITVYTEPKNDGNDIRWWFRSRYNFSVPGQVFNSSDNAKTIDLTGWETLSNRTTSKSEAQAGTDRILAIAINTNSTDEEAYVFTLRKTSLLLANGTRKTINFELFRNKQAMVITFNIKK